MPIDFSIERMVVEPVSFLQEERVILPKLAGVIAQHARAGVFCLYMIPARISEFVAP